MTDALITELQVPHDNLQQQQTQYLEKQRISPTDQTSVNTELNSNNNFLLTSRLRM